MAIYIPNKIRVGYQNREDTFTKKLAYVIYYDNFGKLRKEKSWESWRDKKIEPKEFENVPTSGFVLNKGHTRYNWSHFGNSKTVRIRIYDPRGIEFEITAENLVACLMHTDCSRREITGEMVYAWNGTELMLLPCTSDEYEKAKKHIELQAKKFSAKDLKEGATYLTKSEKKVIYLGRFDYYKTVTFNDKESGVYAERCKSKTHLFCAEEDWPGYGQSEKIKDWYFKPLVPSSALAALATEDIPENYATLVDYYLKQSHHASPIKKYSIKPEREGGYRFTVSDDGKTVRQWRSSSGGYRYSGWYRHSDRYENAGWYVELEYSTSQQKYSSEFQKETPSGLVNGKLVLHYENGAQSDYWRW